MSDQDDDNRFSRCVAEYRRENQQHQFFNVPSLDVSSDNRFIRCVANERNYKPEDRFSCLKSSNEVVRDERQEYSNRFECLRDERPLQPVVQQVPYREYESRREYEPRREYESSSQRLVQQHPYREYESVNAAMKRMRETGELQVTKWTPSTRGVTQDIRKARSKTGLSVDDLNDFPALSLKCVRGGNDDFPALSLMSENVSKSAPTTPIQMIQPQKKLEQIDEIVLPEKDPKEAEYLTIYYVGGKLVKKPVYKDAEGNSTFEAPTQHIIENKKTTYNKWSDLLK